VSTTPCHEGPASSASAGGMAIRGVPVGALLTAALILADPTPAAAQSCTALPADPGQHELWVGVGGWSGAETGVTDISFEFAAFDRLSISGASARGGYDVSTRPSYLRLGAGLLLSVGPVRICPFLGRETMDYTFRNRFAVDYGSVMEDVGEGGIRAEVPLGDVGPVRVSGSLAAGAAFSTWEMNGRRLIVEDSTYVEAVHHIDPEWSLVGEAGLALRWRRLGLAAGVQRRPSLDQAWLGYLRLGTALLRLGPDRDR